MDGACYPGGQGAENTPLSVGAGSLPPIDGSYGGFPELSSMGTAVISGNDPESLQISCSNVEADHAGWDGEYASASLNYDGVWYYGSYLLDQASPPGAAPCNNYCTLGPFVGFDYSTNRGLTWTQDPHTPAKPLFGESTAGGHRIELGALHFVDFGQNMRHSPDGYAYLVGRGGGGPTSQDSWIGADNVYLIRVRPSPQTINDAHAYEFYAGRDAAGEPIWSHRFSDLKPLISWPGHLGSATITLDAAIHTYLMLMSGPSDGVNGTGPYDTMLLESRSLTGPWDMVQYFPHFGPQGYFANVPSKFISPDGLHMWLSYSANYDDTVDPSGSSAPAGSGYAWVLREMTLDPGTAPSPPAGGSGSASSGGGSTSIPSGTASTFSGSCSLTGAAGYSPPLTAVPSPSQTTYTLQATSGSTCSGTLDGKPFSGAVQMMISGKGYLACSHTVSTGATGILDFAPGNANPPTVHFSADIAGPVGGHLMRITGARSGSLEGYLDFVQAGNVSAPAACAAAGVSELGFTASLSNTSPADAPISG